MEEGIKLVLNHNYLDFKHNMDLHKDNNGIPYYNNSKFRAWLSFGIMFFFTIVFILCTTLILIGYFIDDGSIQMILLGFVLSEFTLILTIYSYLVTFNQKMVTAPLALPIQNSNKILMKKTIKFNKFILLSFVIFFMFFTYFTWVWGKHILTVLSALFSILMLIIFLVNLSVQKESIEFNSSAIEIDSKIAGSDELKRIMWNEITSIDITNYPITRKIEIHSNQTDTNKRIINIIDRNDNYVDPCWLVYVLNKLKDMKSDREREIWLKSIASNKKVRLPDAV